MRTYQERVAEIAALLQTLPDAGVVHPRSRLTADWATFLGFFKDGGGQINGWEISRGVVELQPPDVVEHYRLRKYFGIRDADSTDLTFQAHLDAAIRLFRDLPGLSWGSVPVGLRITEVDERMFGGVLVHYAECDLAVLSDYDTL